MGTATERIVVQVTATQKKSISSMAKHMGMNVSELMRRAVERFAPAEDERQIDVLLERVGRSTKEANAAIDETLNFVAQSNKRIQALERGAPDDGH
ncbi:MAG: ribbon-helix-helix protein, CopG family [Pseudomonadota bacterium]|nr:ribbon-helix-helix protein, CopG family [Pseudomonadota bacterium]